MTEDPFSTQLDEWLKSDEPKTLGRLGEVFAEKSFAVMILLLMAPTALPIPTGGLTHIFEVVSVVVAAQMILGLNTLWLPARWRDRALGPSITDKGVPFVSRRVRWFERFSRPRATALVASRTALRVLGAILLILVVVAAAAPPFSGLDTLPGLGVVIIALGIILEDVVVVAVGLGVGVIGAVLVVVLGAAAFQLVSGLW